MIDSIHGIIEKKEPTNPVAAKATTGPVTGLLSTSFTINQMPEPKLRVPVMTPPNRFFFDFCQCFTGGSKALVASYYRYVLTHDAAHLKAELSKCL